MSEQEKSQAFSQYHSMSTEELQEILRKHAHHELEPEPDTEELFEIMQILSERRKNADTPVFRSNEEAFIDFCQYYWPREKDPRHKSGGLKQTFKVVAAVLAIELV